MFTLLFLFIFAVLAQTITDPLVQQIVTILMPVLTFVATWAIQKIKGIAGLPGLIIVALVMPLVALGLNLLASALNATTLPFWQTLIYSLLAVFLSQIQIQWQNYKSDKTLKEGK